MPLEFPQDPACDTLDRQYMLGDNLLVAPVFTPDGWVDYYLPAGRWTHFLTGQVLEGGRWQRERHGFLGLPLLARPNSLVAVGARDDRPDYDFTNGVTLHLFELADGAEAAALVPDVKGEPALRVTAQRAGAVITVQAEGSAKGWKLLLRGVEKIQSVQGGQVEATKQGTLVTPSAGTDRLNITL